jgi:hypothetical protein
MRKKRKLKTEQDEDESRAMEHDSRFDSVREWRTSGERKKGKANKFEIKRFERTNEGEASIEGELNEIELKRIQLNF